MLNVCYHGSNIFDMVKRHEGKYLSPTYILKTNAYILLLSVDGQELTALICSCVLMTIH